MKTMHTMKELLGMLEQNQKDKFDIAPSTSQINLSVDREKEQREIQLNVQDVDGHGDMSFVVNQNCHRQIASRLDMPHKYYNRMLAHAPDLLVDNVNHWLHDKRETRMVRTLRGTARAYLSDTYKRIENEQLAEVAIPILAEVPDLKFTSTAVTETKMYIKAVAPRLEAKVVGDVVQAGIIISNSEVGVGAVIIQPFVLTLRCLNGMALPDDKYSARHIGARISKDEEAAKVLSDEAIKADDHAILLKVRDVIRATLSEDIFNKACDRLREAAGEKIEGDVPGAVKVLAKKSSLLPSEESGVLRHLIEGADLSRYGLLNAVTRYSQDVENYDRASELEVLGGKILDLPRNDWNEIANA